MIDKRERSRFWRRHVSWRAFFPVILALVIGFGIGLAVAQNASNTATEANKGVIQEIADREHAQCMKSNDALAALRSVVNAAFAPGATTRVQAPADPALKDPEVVNYIQRLLNGLSANSNSGSRDRVLAAIPADANCTTIIRH